MNNEQSPLSPFIWVNTFIQSEVVAPSFLISPRGWCSSALNTPAEIFMGTCEKPKMSLEDMRTHTLILACTLTYSICLSVYLSVTLLFLSLSLYRYILVLFYHLSTSSPSTLSAPVRLLWCLFLCCVIFTHWHKHSQHHSMNAVQNSLQPVLVTTLVSSLL